MIAAALWAVLPISQDILAWHGLANLAAICLLPLILVVRGRAGRRRPRAPARRSGFGLLLVALAARPPADRARRRDGHRGCARLGPHGGRARGPATDPARLRRDLASPRSCSAPASSTTSLERARTFGGTQDYRAYLSAKVNLGPVVGDLSVIFTVAGRRGARVRRPARRRATAPWPCCSSLLAVVDRARLLVGVRDPDRLLPDGVLPAGRAGAARRARARSRLLSAAPRPRSPPGSLAVAIAGFAWAQAVQRARLLRVHERPRSLRGLDAVSARAAARTRSSSPTAAGASRPPGCCTRARCRRSSPRTSSRRPSCTARARRGPCSTGRPRASRCARRLGVRYLIVDPTCVDTRERPTRPPAVGTPLYVSKRLVVLRL